MLINRTADNPHGPGSEPTYLDAGGANNTTLMIEPANAKGLGLLAGDAAGSDGAITFNSDMKYDYDRSDGIDADAHDFVGIAFHEIGHLLGFYSGVDWLDHYALYDGGPFDSDSYTLASTLDLFRFSEDSMANGTGVFDWSADDREKYFSVDGGLTNTGAAFTTGVFFGDGWQPGHWRDGAVGIMDPTFAPGDLVPITSFDLRAFDVIGYDLRGAAVPEPTSIATLAVGAVGALGLACRRRA